MLPKSKTIRGPKFWNQFIHLVRVTFSGIYGPYHQLVVSYLTEIRTRFTHNHQDVHRSTSKLRACHQLRGQNTRGSMDQPIQKLLFSRKDAATALSLSVRSIDYLISSGDLITRKIGRKILIPAAEVRRFARCDHPSAVRVMVSEVEAKRA